MPPASSTHVHALRCGPQNESEATCTGLSFGSSSRDSSHEPSICTAFYMPALVSAGAPGRCVRQYGGPDPCCHHPSWLAGKAVTGAAPRHRTSTTPDATSPTNSPLYSDGHRCPVDVGLSGRLVPNACDQLSSCVGTAKPYNEVVNAVGLCSCRSTPSARSGGVWHGRDPDTLGCSRTGDTGKPRSSRSCTCDAHASKGESDNQLLELLPCHCEIASWLEQKMPHTSVGCTAHLTGAPPGVRRRTAGIADRRCVAGSPRRMMREMTAGQSPTPSAMSRPPCAR